MTRALGFVFGALIAACVKLPGSAQRGINRLGRFLRRSASRARHFRGQVIDRRFGVETAGHVHLTELGLARDDRVGYQPSDWPILRRALRRIEVGPRDVFLDLGSGKGRVVLEAARFPFKRVMGVEISPALNLIAAANLEASRQTLQCQDVRLIESDITDFRCPDDVTVVYAYNPFVGATFDAALRALVASLNRRPRRMHLIYLNPQEHDRLLESGQFRLRTRISRWRPGAAWRRSAAVHIYEVRA